MNSRVLHAFIVAAKTESAEFVAQMARESGHIEVDRVFCPMRSFHFLTRALNTFAPDVVLLEMGVLGSAELCAHLKEAVPEAALIGFSIKTPALVDAQWAYAPEPDAPVQPWALTPESLLRTVRQGIETKHIQPFENVIAIMPAKAGTGASTTVLNVSGHLANTFERKVLIMEADLRSGGLAEVLAATPECSIGQTLASADVLPTLLWSQHTAFAHGVNLMATTRDTIQTLPQWYSYCQLLRFVVPKYDQIIVDLPEVINDATAEVVRSSRIVYVVVTPELPALQLARSRLAELERVVPDTSRVRIIVNRWHRRDVHPREISRVLGREIEAVFPNDYPGVRKSILRNSYVDAGTALGDAYRAFAGFLTGANPPPVADERSRLLATFLPTHLRTELLSSRASKA